MEKWIPHYMTHEHAQITERLHRLATFLYETVCAFVIQDLDMLMQRHVRKASQAFVKGGE